MAPLAEPNRADGALSRRILAQHNAPQHSNSRIRRNKYLRFCFRASARHWLVAASSAIAAQWVIDLTRSCPRRTRGTHVGLSPQPQHVINKFLRQTSTNHISFIFPRLPRQFPPCFAANRVGSGAKFKHLNWNTVRIMQPVMPAARLLRVSRRPSSRLFGSPKRRNQPDNHSQSARVSVCALFRASIPWRPRDPREQPL